MGPEVMLFGALAIIVWVAFMWVTASIVSHGWYTGRRLPDRRSKSGSQKSVRIPGEAAEA